MAAVSLVLIMVSSFIGRPSGRRSIRANLPVISEPVRALPRASTGPLMKTPQCRGDQEVKHEQ